MKSDFQDTIIFFPLSYLNSLFTPALSGWKEEKIAFSSGKRFPKLLFDLAVIQGDRTNIFQNS